MSLAVPATQSLHAEGGAPRGPNLLLRASAGTGKTHQLVERYVEMVLRDGLSPAQVVVITFTRKAAAELRQRIERRLREAGASGEVLAALPTAPIDNFHGLCLQLLHAGFGSTLQLPSQPDVLGEENEDLQLFAAAAQATWLTQPALAVDVAVVAGRMAIDDAGLETLWNALARAREDGRTIDGTLWGEDYAPQQVRRALHAEMVSLRRRVVDGAASLDSDKGLANHAAFAALPVPALDAPLSAWASGWQALWGSLNMRSQIKRLIDTASRDDVQQRTAAVVAEASCAALQPAWRQLLAAAWQAYNAAKARQHCRDYADIVAEVVAKLRAEPALHQAVRARIAAVLVDEAQDTNAEQRALVHLLVGLAGPAASVGPQARLLVVGDWKQCIYTFRGADPDNFRNFAEDVRGTGGRDETLACSYRSQPALVAGINALGQHLFPDDYEPLVARPDAPVRNVATAHPAATAPSPSRSSSTPVPTLSGPLADGMHWLPVAGPDEKKAPSAEVEAGRVADVVAQALAHGTAPQQVAILLAGIKAKAATYLGALAARGIDAVTSGGGALYAREEVRQFLSLLAYLADERCVLPAAVALRSPLLALTDEALWATLSPAGRAAGALAALRRGDAAPALAVLGPEAQADAQAALADAARLLPVLVAAVQGSSPAAACQAVIDALDVRALWLAGPEGPQRAANLERVLALAARAERQQNLPAAAFALQQLSRMQAGVVEGEGAVPGAAQGAVTLSTVHKSKGLQWRLVVLAGLASAKSYAPPAVLYHRRHGLVFAPEGPRGALQSARYLAASDAARDDEAHQLRRLLYVAMTRAQERVVFVAPAGGGARVGFYGLLAPWQQGAPAELNVLRPEDVPAVAPGPLPAPSPEAQRREEEAVAARAEALATPRQLPPGTAFHATVTELAQDQTLAPASASAPTGHPRPFDDGGHSEQGAQPRVPPDDKTGVHPASSSHRAGPWLATLVAQAMADDALAADDVQARGTLVHRILAHWPSPESGDEAADAAALGAWLRHCGVSPSSRQFVQVYGDLLAFGRSAMGQRLRRLSSCARRHELSFQLTRTVGGVHGVLRGQIDLLAWEDGAPWVVDFKYARRRPNEAAYLRQLDAYAWAASELCGHEGPVSCHLIYLREAGTVTHHVATPARQAAARARLDAWTTARAYEAGQRRA